MRETVHAGARKSPVYHVVVGKRAGTPDDWAQVHWDTYGFRTVSTMISASRKLGIVVCIPTGNTDVFERELRADHVEFFRAA